MGDARRRGARQHRANLGQYLCRASGAAVQAGEEVKFAADSLQEGAVRCELVSAAGSDSAPYEFLESIKKERPQPSDALPPFSCNQN